MVKQLAQGHKLLDALLEKEPKPAALGPALLTTTLFLTATCTKCLSGLPDAAPEMWTQARTTQGSRLPRHHPSSPPCFPPALVDEARSPLELWTPSTPFLSETPLPHQSASICSFSIPASSTYAYVSSFPKANCPESSVAINTLLSLSSSLRLKKDLILGSLLPHLLLPPPPGSAVWPAPTHSDGSLTKVTPLPTQWKPLLLPLLFAATPPPPSRLI